MAKNISIIYIIGAGRSGTTLLDIVLGNSKKIFSAGELNRFTEYNGFTRNARNMQVDQFWQNVRSDLNSKGYDSPESYYKSFRKFEYHKYFWRILIPYQTNTSAFKKYSEYQKSLFEAVSKNSNIESETEYIVDSSKYALKAYYLSKIFPKSISYIYIKRNPSDVVTSFQKQGVEQLPKNRIKAHLYLFSVNYISKYTMKLLRKNNFKTSVIYYEQLSKHTIETLTQIEKDLSIDLSSAKRKIDANENLTVGYLFEGNRLRLKNEILFERRETDTTNNLLNRILMVVHKFFWYGL